MDRHTRTWPARLSSSAATDESTPPDIPTTTRSGIFAREYFERKPAPGDEIVDAALHQRRAVLGAPRHELVAGEPVQRGDLRIQRPRIDALDAPAEAKAQEGHVL